MLRDFQALVRVKKILGARLALTTFMGVLTGFIFLRVGDNDMSDPVVRIFSVCLVQSYGIQYFFIAER
jgi:type IV secretory pathway VirB3-like protein